MVIREATAEDLTQLNEFYARMNEVINRRTGKYNPDNPVFPSEEMVRKAVEQHGQFVGMEDGRIVSACIANHEGTPEYDTAPWQMSLTREEYWVLHALRIDPNYEGRGFAKQMLAFLIKLGCK